MRVLYRGATALFVMGVCLPNAGSMIGAAEPSLSLTTQDPEFSLCGSTCETDVERRRMAKCLNDLVESSVEDPDQAANLAFVRTHKTGSTTMSALFVRYAQRRGLTWAQYDGQPRPGRPLAATAPKILRMSGRVDVMHYHMAVGVDYFPPAWEKSDELYRRIMRDPDRINYVTVLREPREQMISYYYYFLEPKYKMSIEDFVMNGGPDERDIARLVNPSAREFGIRTPDQLESFFDSALSTFKLVMLTEHFDEGLCLLRRLMGWGLIDITYLPANETRKTKISRITEDGAKVFTRPHFKDLPVEVQVRIDEMTVLDRAIYERGAAIWEETLKPLASEVAGDLGPFRDLQRAVKGYLVHNSTSLAHEFYDVNHITEKWGFYPSATTKYNF